MNNYYPKKYNYHKYTNYKQYAYNLPEHSNKPFSESLTQLIRGSGITDLELCKAMRVSNTTIANYRKGKPGHKPKKEFIQRLADFFDIKPSYFWEYRKFLLEEYLEKNPEMLDVFLDISTTPRRILDEYRRHKEISFQ